MGRFKGKTASRHLFPSVSTSWPCRTGSSRGCHIPLITPSPRNKQPCDENGPSKLLRKHRWGGVVVVEKAHIKLLMNNTSESPGVYLLFFCGTPSSLVPSSSSFLGTLWRRYPGTLMHLDFETDNMACESEGSGEDTH